jgi:SAM-dependent methyltransferase
VTAYVLEPEPAELDRLLDYAERESPQVELTCRLAGLGAGAAAVDVGCGPLGALATLSRIVGPSGRVVGIDASGPAVETARRLVARLGLENVTLVQAELGALPPALGGRFDLAYCRLVLLHQPDPRRALEAVAALARPGAFVAYQDIVDDPTYPRCEPPVEAMSRAWGLLLDLFRARGLTPDVARQHAALADRPGWTLVAQRGKFAVLGAAEGFRIVQQLLTAARNGLAETGLATPAEVDALIAALERAKGETFRFWHGPLAVETLLRIG